MKVLKANISGSYLGPNKEVIDFENVEGIVPFTDEMVAEMHIRGRYAQMWLAQDDNYPERVTLVREVHIDRLEESTGELSYVGKDIKEMSFEELQDLAVAKDLREIPLYKAGSIRNARERAYAVYSTNVLKERLDWRSPDFKYAELPPLTVDGNVRTDKVKKSTNDDIINAEQKNTKTQGTSLSRSELEQIAAERNITFHPNISDENLYNRIYKE